MGEIVTIMVIRWITKARRKPESRWMMAHYNVEVFRVNDSGDANFDSFQVEANSAIMAWNAVVNDHDKWVCIFQRNDYIEMENGESSGLSETIDEYDI